MMEPMRFFPSIFSCELSAMSQTTNVQGKISPFFLLVVFFAVLFFGLNPKDFSFTNSAGWIEDQAGIRFTKYGMAYTDLIAGKTRGEPSESEDLSVEIALKQEKPQNDGFKFIFVVHDGRDSNQLLMAQWRSWIILMNGDDYAHKRRTGRLALDTARLPAGPLFLTVTTGSHGTKLYSGGSLVREKKDLTLRLPGNGEARLLVGNSVYGKHSWVGDLYGLAFYRSTLTRQDSATHFSRWAKERNFAFAKADKPFMLFLFDERQGRWAFDHSGGNRSLNMPEKMIPLARKPLVPPWQGFKPTRAYMIDLIVNFLGFIPFGFLVSASLHNGGGKFRKHGALIAVGLCLAVSLFIEIVQAWLPSRNSSLSDLMLNSFGGWIGARLYLSPCGRLYDEVLRIVSGKILAS